MIAQRTDVLWAGWGGTALFLPTFAAVIVTAGVLVAVYRGG